MQFSPEIITHVSLAALTPPRCALADALARSMMPPSLSHPSKTRVVIQRLSSPLSLVPRVIPPPSGTAMSLQQRRRRRGRVPAARWWEIWRSPGCGAGCVGREHLPSYFTVHFGVPFSSLARSSVTSVVGCADGRWLTGQALFSRRGGKGRGEGKGSFFYIYFIS